jgi:hypothetical protein
VERADGQDSACQLAAVCPGRQQRPRPPEKHEANTAAGKNRGNGEGMGAVRRSSPGILCGCCTALRVLMLKEHARHRCSLPASWPAAAGIGSGGGGFEGWLFASLCTVLVR